MCNLLPPLLTWSLEITLTEFVVFFLHSGVEKLLSWPGIEPQTLDSIVLSLVLLTSQAL